MADNTGFSNLGFIGLGAMGKPMVLNLAKNTASGSRVKIHVHDVVAAAVDEAVSSFPDIIVKCASAKEVTEKSVRCFIFAGSQDTNE